MDLAIGFDIELAVTGPTLLLGALSVHPSVEAQLVAPEQFSVTPALPFTRYVDAMGNRITHLPIPADTPYVRLRSAAVVLLKVAVGAVSEQLAAVPKPTKSTIAPPSGQAPDSVFWLDTSATLPAVDDIGMPPLASGAGRSVVPPLPAASWIR